MKKKSGFITLIISALVLVFVIDLMSTSCKKKSDEESEEPSYPAPVTWSPAPINGAVPPSVLPEELAAEVGSHIQIYAGPTPAKVHGEFLSHPHRLLYSTASSDTIGTDFYDRYICFEWTDPNFNRIDFYGKQQIDEEGNNYEEVYRNIYVVGTGENFTCYYITEGYPQGLYAKQATIFSGNWTESLGGLGNFKVAVILLETSGNPNLEPVNTYRVLGDSDGLAENCEWMKGKRSVTNATTSHEDAFRMFIKK